MQKEYGLSSSADCYLNKYQKILNEMIQKMTETELTNSISHNFIVQMIPHHKAAIEMSKNVLCYTENKKLQDIAKGIISEQTKSIENMLEIEGFCEKLENSCKAVDFYQCRTRKIMQVMFAEMSKAYSDNRIDCDFMREMIPHHLGAVKMSKNALQFHICPELKPILDAIIISQEKGICQMRKLLCCLNCRI